MTNTKLEITPKTIRFGFSYFHDRPLYKATPEDIVAELISEAHKAVEEIRARRAFIEEIMFEENYINKNLTS